MLNELGLEYELRPVSPRSGETHTEDYLKINPRGKIPALQDGDFVLCESVAINTYLGAWCVFAWFPQSSLALPACLALAHD